MWSERGLEEGADEVAESLEESFSGEFPRIELKIEPERVFLGLVGGLVGPPLVVPGLTDSGSWTFL